MAKIPDRLVGPQQVATGPTTVYTAPAGGSLARWIRVSNPSGGAVTFTLSVGTDSTSTRVYYTVSIAAGGVFFDYPYLELDEGEILQVSADSNNVLVLTVGGDALEATSLLPGMSSLVYKYTVTGSDKASIDTGVDTADAGSNDWTDGDVLEVWVLARTDDAGAVVNIDMTFNNDTGSNYDRQIISGAGTTASAATQLANAFMGIVAHGSGGSSGYAAVNHCTIPGYAGTTFNKTMTAHCVIPDATSGNNRDLSESFGWRSTDAITRIKVAAESTAKLKVGSQLLIYKRSSG